MSWLPRMVTLMALLLIVMVLVTVMQLRGPVLDFSCASWFRQSNTSDDFDMTSNTLFTFTPDGKGLISMDGAVMRQGETFKLRRDYNFTYRHAGGNRWQLMDVDMTQAGSDNVPAGLVERNFYNTVTKTRGNYIYVAQVRDIKGAWTVGGLYSPAFMCVDNSR
ncbi:hypothetical protein ACOQH0_23540 (plasmid) [Enterobacter sp. JS8-1]|uniref:hypothetical protein n=1 Tax=Enterobacter sp. JS8-1 TaxID=3411633 RepID=UPI003BA016A3